MREVNILLSFYKEWFDIFKAVQVHQANCTHCGVLLRFPPNAIAISCAACRGVSYQGRCSSCSRCLVFPPSVSLVSCSACRAVTEFAISSMRQATCPACTSNVLVSFATCHTDRVDYLPPHQFPGGAPAVRCSVCSTVFHVQQGGNERQSAVIIENPGEDEDSVAIGYELPTVAPDKKRQYILNMFSSLLLVAPKYLLSVTACLQTILRPMFC